MDDDEEVEEEVESPSTFPLPLQPTRQQKSATQARPQNPPLTRVTKTGKVQELVQAKAPKLPDPIRAMAGRPRFSIDSIFNIPIEIPLGELLDRSDMTVKEMAFGMQRATPRYRVKKAPKQTVSNQEEPSGASLVVTASVQKEPPVVIAHAHEDDGQS